MRIDHIAIAVDDLPQAIELFARLLRISFDEPEFVESQKTMVAFANLENCKLELIEAASEKSPLFPILPHPVKKFVETHGWGLHHIAFTTQDLDWELDRLAKDSFNSLEETPSEGAQTSVSFVDPTTTKGVLVEFCQELKGKE